MPLGHSGPGVAASVRWSPNAISDSSASDVILLALSTVEGSERSLPAVAGEPQVLYLPGLPRPPKPVEGVGGSKLWWLCAMNDNPTIIVILSERSESKDLYLPQLLCPPNPALFRPHPPALPWTTFHYITKRLTKFCI